MADVIDVRPDLFLKELRNGKLVSDAAEASGITLEEISEMMKASEEFGWAARNCILEYAEEQIRDRHAKRIAAMRNFFQSIINGIEADLVRDLKRLRETDSFAKELAEDDG